MTEAADVVEEEVLQLERPNRRFADLRRLSGAFLAGNQLGEISVSMIDCRTRVVESSNCLLLITQRTRYLMSVLGTDALTL